mmetsp:Transcript_1405/g.4623  ORF Transcript_1405/g.4623 Transcript_1405/m.4623 type:complete len:218 (-) Transcript_1405:644-1297(-)
MPGVTDERDEQRTRTHSPSPPSPRGAPGASVVTAARLLDVSARPGSAWLTLRTPCGKLTSTARTRSAASGVSGGAPLRQSAAPARSGRSSREPPCSRRPYSARNASALSAAAAHTAPSASGGTRRTAEASRGIALCLSPPSIATRPTPRAAPSACCAARAASCTALAWPLSMQIPEWPPSSPCTRSSQREGGGAACAGGSRAIGSASRASPPPAQPM